jgi:MoaA/NifB/PqqE/SkfB family radical SAM enzyme
MCGTEASCFAFDPEIPGSIYVKKPERNSRKMCFATQTLVGDVDEFCAPPPAVNDDVLQEFPCSAGHTACYISPYGDLFPCVQFPLPSGNVRRQKFMDISRHSPVEVVESGI